MWHRFFSALVALWAVTAVAVAATEAPDQAVADHPVPVLGDVFEYVGRFESIDCQRWELTSLQSNGVATYRCQDNQALFDSDGALLKILGGDGQPLVTFSPRSVPIPFPLHVGDRWSGHFKLTTAWDLVSPTIDESCQAVSYETVAVAAGKLPAFRISCKDDWSVGFLSGTSDSTLWYAAVAKSVVKAISTGEEKWNLELAHFQLR